MATNRVKDNFFNVFSYLACDENRAPGLVILITKKIKSIEDTWDNKLQMQAATFCYIWLRSTETY